MSTKFGFDAYSPKEISERVETLGVSKGRLPLLSTLVLGVLAFSLTRITHELFGLGLILVFLSGHLDSNQGAVSAQYVKIAAAKCNLPF